MPRKATIDAPGALHHVIRRGINRQKIFSDKTDYINFLERLGDLLIETKNFLLCEISGTSFSYAV
jgi:putative transposase